MDLQNYRNQIDRIDNDILRLFKERMDVCFQIAQYKKEHNLPALDAEREKEKLTVIGENVSSELRPYAHSLFTTVFELSRLYQKETLL